MHQEGESNVTFKQPPLPPEIPPMPETGNENFDSGTIAKLMEQFNNQLKIELNNDTNNIVNKVVEMVEIKLKIVDVQQQGSNHDSGLVPLQEPDNHTTNNPYY